MSEKRNRAVKLSRDKYIAFIDSDATATNCWVKNGINILKKNKNIANSNWSRFYPFQTKRVGQK